ncbi:MAG: AtpZ/AtpI family protein [Ginsengibacter sp.]
MEPVKNNNNSQMWRYAGLASQFLVSIGIGVFIGVKLDQWMKPGLPVFVWVLPLLMMAGIIFRLIKDTSSRK